jgi:hypothetical protein
MKFKSILFSLLIYSLNAYALFDDFKYDQDKNCLMNFTKQIKPGSDPEFGQNSMRPINCAIHKKKPEMNFCEGDVVVFKLSNAPQQIYLIRDGKAYADDTTANRSTKNFIEQTVSVKVRNTCPKRLELLEKNRDAILRLHGYNL